MKIRIEGCTTEELAAYSPYLSLGKVYEVQQDYASVLFIADDEGDDIGVDRIGCAHLPEGAKWVEVTE